MLPLKRSEHVNVSSISGQHKMLLTLMRGERTKVLLCKLERIGVTTAFCTYANANQNECGVSCHAVFDPEQRLSRDKLLQHTL